MESDSRLLGDFLGAVCLAGFLSLAVTWVLASHFLIPDSEAVILGLVGFLFVMFFDGVLICRLIGREVFSEEGVKLTGTFLGVGLLVALAAAAVIYWLATGKLSVAMLLFIVATAPNAIMAIARWLARKNARGQATGPPFKSP